MSSLIENLCLLRRIAAVFVLVLAATAVASEKGHAELMPLDLIGYNYTNYYIDSYSVDGQAGGNIMVSSLTSGGGKVVCCLMLEKELPAKFRVEVRWQSGGCRYKTKSNVSGKTFEDIHSFYKATEVEVIREIRVRPRNLEVHFFPDGSIEAQLTENLSRPRVLRDKARADRKEFPRCKDDKKPSR